MAEENSTDYVVKLRVDTSEARLPSQEFQRMASISGLIGRTLTQSITKANIPAKSLLKTFQEVEASAEKIGKYLARGTTDAITASFAKGLKSAVDSVIGELGTSIGEAIQAGLDRVTGKAGIRKDNPTGIGQMVSSSNLAKTVSDSNNIAQQQQQAQAKSEQDVSTYVSRIKTFTEAMSTVNREQITNLEQVGKVMQETGADTEAATKAIENYIKKTEDAAAKKPNVFQFGKGNKPAEPVGYISTEDILKRTEARIQKMTQAAAKGTGDVQQQAAQQAEAGAKKAEGLVQRIKAAWQGVNEPITIYSAKITAVQNKLDGIYRAMSKLEDKKVQTDQWKELQANIRQVTKNIEDASGFALSMGDDPNENQGIVRMKEALAGLEQQEQELINTNQVYIDQTKTNQYAVLAAQAEQYQARLAELKSEDYGTTRLREGMESVKTVLSEVGKKALSIFGKLFVGGVKKAISAVKSLFSTIKKKAADNGVTKAIDNLTKKFTNLWSMLVTRIKRRAIATVFNDIKDTFQQMAQINPEFNESVSGMVNSARRLGAQILAIVEPIITRLGPYIAQLADYFASLADKLSQFTAKAFGYNMYSKAEKGAYDYAKSVDETTDSTKKATKAAKDYQNTVMGFDQLNKLNGSEDGSDATDDANAKLERAESEANAFNHIAEEIWNALNNHDYYGAGSAMAAAVNSAFGWLDNTLGWENNAAKFTEKFQNLGDIVNGFIDNLRAADIGHAFGNILNTAINGLDILMNDAEHGIHFEKLGDNIGQMLITAVQTIHWDKLGSGLAGALTGIGTALMTALTTTVENPDTGEEETLGVALGNAVLKFLQGVNDKLDPEKIGGAIGSIIDTITGFFAKAFSDHQAWATLGAKIGQSLTTALNEMDQAQMEQAIYNFCYSMGVMLGEFVKNVDWVAALKALWAGIKAGAAGIADAIDETLYKDFQSEIDLNNLAERGIDMDTRIAMRTAKITGQHYRSDFSELATGSAFDPATLERQKALEQSIAYYKQLLQGDFDYSNMVNGNGYSEEARQNFENKIAAMEQELAGLMDADGVGVHVDTVVIQPQAVTADTTEYKGANSDKEGSDVDALVKSTSELTEAIKNGDKDMTINIGGMPFAKLVLTALNQLNTQYGQGLV